MLQGGIAERFGDDDADIALMETVLYLTNICEKISNMDEDYVDIFPGE